MEKHLTLDRSLVGSDAAFSLGTDEFKEMVKSVREVEVLGEVSYVLKEKMKKSREFSRPLFIVKNIKAGGILTRDNVRIIRPGYGLPPKYYDIVLGKKVKANIEKGIPLK